MLEPTPATADLAKLTLSSAQLDAEIRALRGEMAAVRVSTSWRVSRPLRLLKTRLTAAQRIVQRARR